MPIYDWAPNADSRLSRLESGRQFLRGGKIVYTDSNYASLPKTALNSSQVIDTTSSVIAKVGSVPIAVGDSGFSATATTTSIHWFWDGTNGSSRIIVRRADSTKIAIPKGDLNVTGLVANTMYFFYPFWSVSQSSFGWVIGTVGSPKVAHAAANANGLAAQKLQDREALSAGAMTFSTPAAGTTGGTPAGGGGAPGHGGYNTY